MSDTKEKFNEARFNEYNRPATDLFRLKRDMYWLLSQTKGYSEDIANKQWDDHIKKVTAEENARFEKLQTEKEKRSKFEDEEYTKCFKELLLPVINGVTYAWDSEIVCPVDEDVKFKLIGAIGSGSYNKDYNKMRAEIAGRWLNNSLEFRIPITPIRHLYKDGDKMKTHTQSFWNFWVTFKLR